MTQPNQNFVCQACGGWRLVEIEDFHALPRITSDCRPFPPGGHLASCCDCGAIQKFPDRCWLEEISRIYADYTPYSQADGIEQVVLDSESGQLRRRSDVIVSKLLQETDLPNKAEVLDVGCGSGATLKVLSRARPGWALYGAEISEKGHEHLKNIQRFKGLYTCPLSEIERRFDLITLVHSLEHFSDPYQMLVDLRSHLKPNGVLFVQLYNTAANPFDIIIADHLMHFTANSLRRTVARAGFEVRQVNTDWIAKELSLIANLGAALSVRDSPGDTGVALSNVRWLSEILRSAQATADGVGRMGLFGTSISGTWLIDSLGERVEFFVDEDPHRQGRNHCGRPVLKPDNVPAGATVYLALTPAVAAGIQKRLGHLDIRFVLPPKTES